MVDPMNVPPNLSMPISRLGRGPGRTAGMSMFQHAMAPLCLALNLSSCAAYVVSPTRFTITARIHVDLESWIGH